MLIRDIRIAFNSKHFFLGAFFALILFLSYLASFPDGKLHAVFCDVGQGDAVYLKLPDGSDVLVDGGPNNKVLNCLGDHMAFYDRKIEIVILTHPQADHLTGLNEVLKRYEVEMFVLPPVGNDTKGYRELKSLIEEKNISVANLYSGNVVQFNGREKQSLSLKVLWPEEQWTRAKLQLADTGSNWSKNILGAETSHKNLNDFSIVVLVSYGKFDVLLTGDLEADLLKNALKNTDLEVEVVKVPHHGARIALSEEIVSKLKAKLAVISVGKNNYGHPSGRTLEILRSLNVETFRTDEHGEIQIVSDGERFWVLKP